MGVACRSMCAPVCARTGETLFMKGDRLRQLRWVAFKMEEVLRDGFFGTVRVDVVDGDVKLIKVEQSYKPPGDG